MTTFPESHQDLLTSDVAILATVGKDGYPQVSALWFLFDNGELKLSLNSTRQKTKNLQANPECTLFIISQQNLYHTIEIRAKAEIVPDDDYSFADTLSRKYNADIRANDRPGESRVVVTLHPVKVNVFG